ncbi:cysteine sulfinate desulfinase [Candidatus Riesia sp. GBBU]|nr:cysteine sulfinate desulfinase [Candidatus Riesia sp. GBBU]
MKFPIKKIRKNFPILERKINGFPLVYLDNASSSQKPKQLIEVVKDFYSYKYAPIHRGNYNISNEATFLIENIRHKISKFLNSSYTEEIVFVKGTTEAINSIVHICSKCVLKKGDNIIITQVEHHSNILPWIFFSKQIGFEIRILPINDDGILIFEKLEKMIDSRTKFFSFSHISNVLGIMNPVKKIIKFTRKCAKRNSTYVYILVDGAQAIMHQKIDVQDLDCDFYVFSGHKIYGPTGIGILYGKRSILDFFTPCYGGGAMIKDIKINLLNFSKSDIKYEDIPWKFEAGTQNIVGIVGLGAAIDYISSIGLEKIHDYEKKLAKYAYKTLSKINSIKIYGMKNQRISIISFNIGSHSSYDVGKFLDNYSILIRTGHLCAKPLMKFYQVPSMCRVSFAIYNTKDEVEFLCKKLIYLEKILN